MPKESVVDASRPSPGRIYDYLLGGHHNFEIDRQAGDRILQLVPFARKYARFQRWALQDLAVELTVNRGYDTIVDFASGLPTNDHIHHKVAAGTTVIYSDYDPILVEYAHEILGEDTPNVYYFLSDASRPEELLSRPEVQQILKDRRKVAFIHWGVSIFLPDDAILHTAQTLYEWAAPGSCWAFNAQTGNADDPASKRVIDIYKAMGTIFYYRSCEKYTEMLKPWQVDAKGFIPLLEWHGFDQSELTPEEIHTFGAMGGGHGAFLIK